MDIFWNCTFNLHLHWSQTLPFWGMEISLLFMSDCRVVKFVSTGVPNGAATQRNLYNSLTLL